MDQIRMGVRQLIEFVMRSGDIDGRYRSARRMQEGIKAHQQIQASYGKGYRKEVPFEDTTLLEGIAFHLEGRADGVFESEEEVLIDEIKSTTRTLDSLDAEGNPLHWAQAKCYAYFYCKEKERDQIKVQLTYVNLEEEDLYKKIIRTFERSELEDFYLDLLRRYLIFSRLLVEWKKKRDQSLKQLSFPYPTYRPGQRKLAVSVYQTIEEGGSLFVEAPTGIGKTISTLFPALFGLAHLDLKQIYYLTARTTTQREPQKALQLLREEGLALKNVTLTAKEKICLNDRLLCDPNACPYAKGHFDRVNEAIIEIFREASCWDRETITRYAEKHRICPHEFQLDLSSFADFVLCDYNYFFDPRVYLRRAFDGENTDALILVDEAHNLVDRGRDMYSAALSVSELKALRAVFSRKAKNRKKNKKGKKEAQALIPGQDLADGATGTSILEEAPSGKSEQIRKISRSHIQKVVRKADDLISVMEKFHMKQGGLEAVATEENPEELYRRLKSLMAALDPYLSRAVSDEDYDQVLEWYFDLSAYSKIEETRMEGFLNLLTVKSDGLHWQIRCIDPTALFEASLRRVQAAIFFSATLSPMDYYRRLLGGGSKARVLHLDSPFPPEHAQFAQVSLSTRYRDRAREMDSLISVLRTFRLAHPGNLMVFFPSYAYLEETAAAYQRESGEEMIIQARQMDEEARNRILDRYCQEEGLLGFFVLGGLFAEGIDLPGKSLTGVAVVSVGLPGLSFEQDVIKRYFDQKNGKGFEYAYTYPGMNRVLQAAGRLIRTEEDRGQILLIDDRFATPRYRALMPRHWRSLSLYPTAESYRRAMIQEGGAYGQKETMDGCED